MTTTPDQQPLTGRHIGETENALRAILDRLLAEADMSFHQWVLLNAVGTTEPALTPDHAVDRVAHGLKADPAVVRATLDGLLALGLLVVVDDHLRLTASGTARFERIRAGVQAVTGRLYRDIPLADLVTARQVLETVTARANAELAATR